MPWLHPATHDGRTSFGLLALRVVTGLAFIQHGWPKIQNPMGWMGPDAPMPGFLLALAAVAEFGGGIALILGLLIPLATLGLLCTMAVAMYTHISRGDPWVGQGGPAWELASIYFTIALLLFLAGPGRYSLDAQLFRGAKASPAPDLTP